MNDFVQKTYPPLYAKAMRTVAKPGDRIAMEGARRPDSDRRRRRDQDAAAWRWPIQPMRAVHTTGTGRHRECPVGGHARVHADVSGCSTSETSHGTRSSS